MPVVRATLCLSHGLRYACLSYGLRYACLLLYGLRYACFFFLSHGLRNACFLSHGHLHAVYATHDVSKLLHLGAEAPSFQFSLVQFNSAQFSFCQGHLKAFLHPTERNPIFQQVHTSNVFIEIADKFIGLHKCKTYNRIFHSSNTLQALSSFFYVQEIHSINEKCGMKKLLPLGESSREYYTVLFDRNQFIKFITKL